MKNQLSIYDYIPSDFPCDNCVFDEAGSCNHIYSDSMDCEYRFFCVDGSFQVKHDSAKCPECGRAMTVRQCEFGSDFATCKCGLHKTFNNQGNRLGWLDAWKQGMVVGT